MGSLSPQVLRVLAAKKALQASQPPVSPADPQATPNFFDPASMGSSAQPQSLGGFTTPPPGTQPPPGMGSDATPAPPPPQPPHQVTAADYQSQMPPPPGYSPPMPHQVGAADYANQMPPPGSPQAQVTPAASTSGGAATVTGKEGDWNSTGKTDDFGSFFNKKTSSDALTAFGAAMLKAPTFLQGLGAAGEAVNQVDQANRMPSPAQIAQARLKAEMQGLAYGLRPRNKFGETSTMWTPQGQWNQIFDKTTGNNYWQGPKGEQQANPPEGGIPFSATGQNQSAIAGAKDETTGFERAQAAQLQLPALDRQLSLIKSGQAGVGMGALADLKRTIVSTTGVSFGGVEPKDMNELTKMFAAGLLDAAAGQKGLGALSDGERALIERASATGGSDPQAIIDMLGIQKQRLQRISAMQNAWDHEKETNHLTANSYRSFVDKFTNEWDKKTPFNYNTSGNQPASGAPNTSNPPPAQTGVTSTKIPWKVIQ